MPAINVARTDTFEIQRQKINQIGDILSNISAGGSDLQTGNLKLGDGTRTSPSLSFINDGNLGVYRSNESLIFVDNGKELLSLDSQEILSLKDFSVKRKSIFTEGLNIISSGSSYDTGTYNNVRIIGGSGEGALATIEIVSFDGSITNIGGDYNPGTYTGIPLDAGTISGATGSSVNFEVENIDGTRTSGDGLYTSGTYENVPFQGGSGSGAEATIFVDSQSGEVTYTVTNIGVGYQYGDVLTINSSDVGGTGSGFQIEVESNPGRITNFEFSTKTSGYQDGDILRLIGSTQETVTLDNTDATVLIPDVTNIVADSVVTKVSGSGDLAADTTVSFVDYDNNVVILSEIPTTSGSTVLQFTPPYGSPANAFTFEVESIGSLGDIQVLEGGAGYNVGDTVSVDSTELVQPIEYSVAVSSVQDITFTGGVIPDTEFSIGDQIKVRDGNIESINQLTSSTILAEAGNSYIGVASTTTGNGTGATFDVERDIDGIIFPVVINSPGFEYAVGDSIVIPGNLVGGSSPADDITLEADVVGISTPSTIRNIETTGSFVTKITIDDVEVLATNNLVKTDGSTTNPYVVLTASSANLRYLIDTGSGYEMTPDLTFYVGSSYTFDYSDSTNSIHNFALSKFPDGRNSPSYVSNIGATFDTTTTVTVSDSSNILVGMQLFYISGAGIPDDTTLVTNIVDATTIEIDKVPLASGSAVIDFRGVEYTDGVTREGSKLTISVNDTTPTLYYYCTVEGSIHENMGGSDNLEATITIDPNNPKVFGSGISIDVTELDILDVATFNLSTSETTLRDLNAESVSVSNLTAETTIEATTLTSTFANLTNISSTNLTLGATNFNINSDVNIGSTIEIERSSGDILTSGEVKTLDKINVNDILFLENNTISAVAGSDIIIDPPLNAVLKVNAETALQIPRGTENDKPNTSYNGYIRFNTDTNQYEGYSEATSSWSSLGGVRDLDGNTTILAEQTVGANDNTLWFINDAVNTVRFTKTHQEFVNAKRIRSVNTSAPAYTTWQPSTPVSSGSYLRYKTNVYEVVSSGTTSTTGNEPTDTSGNNFANGTATLRYVTTSAAPLVFEETSLVRFAENVPVSINNDLRLTTNTISSDISDITIKPYDEKKVVIDATSSLVLPVGDNNQKGAASRGSVRYNTTDNQFEGFNGTQWGGLGGVKDIDQDTQIKAETAPGEDEDILYFFNGGDETLRVTQDQIEFNSIDTVVSSISDTLNIDVSLVTFDSLATTLDNSDTSTTFLSSTKTNLDFGLASGLNNDHLLRLTNTGEVIFNLGFGTGTDDNLTLLNNNLTTFDLKHVKVNTSRIELERGVFNSGNATVYSISTEASAKVQVTAFNITTGDKELIEFYVVDDGTDVFFTEKDNIKTGAELISTSFDIDPSNNVRITVTSNSALTVGDNIEVTIIKTITKR